MRHAVFMVTKYEVSLRERESDVKPLAESYQLIAGSWHRQEDKKMAPQRWGPPRGRLGLTELGGASPVTRGNRSWGL